MPEAPEVETVRRQLVPLLPFTIQQVFVSNEGPVANSPFPVSDLAGAFVSGVGRVGKWLTLDVGSNRVLALHFRMSGTLLLSPHPVPKHSHVKLALGTGEELHFVDPRRFGKVGVFFKDSVPWPSTPDVLDGVTDFSPVSRSRRALKAVLLNQHQVVQGVGNYVADEVCFRARVRPTTACFDISEEVWVRVRRAIPEVVHLFAAARGTSLADEGWRDLFGALGGGSGLLQVHSRGVCGVCGGPVTKVRVAGRSTYFCQSCQK